MRYDPSEAKQPGNNVPPGTYEFNVVSAHEKTSKQGNAMIEVQLAVFAPCASGAIPVRDWLVNTPGGLWKCKNFCHATGLDFDTGELVAESCVNRTGSAKFDFDKRDLAAVAAGTKEKAYLRVDSYVSRLKTGAAAPPPARQTAPPAAAPAPPAAEPEDDGIPF